MKKTILIGCLISAAMFAGNAPGSGFPKLTGPYLGQKPPGLTPEIFAPGIVCTGINERDVAVSADGREMYIGITSGRIATILWTRRQGDRWSEPVVAPFAADDRFFHLEPALSADGKRIFFLSTRPAKDGEIKPGWANQTIWAAERKPDGSWGEPYDPAPALNSDGQLFFPSLTRDGTLYFTRMDRQTRKTAIHRSRLVRGEYSAAERLPDAVNGSGTPYNAFISPDESYLIACVDGRECPGNPGRANYFVFFRDPGGHWSDGVPFGPEVNRKGSTAMSPHVSPDGRYFFFAAQQLSDRFKGSLGGRSLSQLLDMNASCQNGNYDIHWVDAGFIEALRPK